MPVCAKMISYRVRKVLDIAREHMSPGILQGPAVSMALAAGVSLLSILPADKWARVGIPAIHYCAVLGLSE